MPWKSAQTSSETGTSLLAAGFAAATGPGDWILLEGPMGSGKSFFARAVLKTLGIRQPPEGSPTFAIAHEYESIHGVVAHIDFYRLKNSFDAEAAGISSYFWERKITVISEWTSLHPDFFEQLVLPRPEAATWLVKLDFCRAGEFCRNIEIRVISRAASR